MYYTLSVLNFYLTRLFQKFYLFLCLFVGSDPDPSLFWCNNETAVSGQSLESCKNNNKRTFTPKSMPPIGFYYCHQEKVFALPPHVHDYNEVVCGGQGDCGVVAHQARVWNPGVAPSADLLLLLLLPAGPC